MLRTILIADDEPLKLMTLRECLKRAGYEVITAEDGCEALDLLNSNKVDALITDVHMPQMDGFTLLEIFKELGPKRPALVITGCGSREDKDRALCAGADYYLEKPGSNDVILGCLERAFR